MQMVLILSCIGVLLSVILLYNHARRFSIAVYLGMFFFGVSLYSFYHYVLFSSKSVTVVSYSLLMIPVLGSVVYLIGPLLYWYVRSVINDHAAFRKRDVWHLIPMFIFFLSALPGLFTPWSVKTEAATAIVNDVRAMGLYKPTLLSGIFSYPFMFLSRPVLILCYALWSMIIFIPYFLRRKEMKIFSGQLFMIKWLFFLLTSLIMLLLSHILLAINFSITGSNMFVLLTILKVLALTGLIVLILSPFFFPGVLYGLPRVPTLSDIPGSPVAESSENQSKIRKTETRFEADYLDRIRAETELCMKEFKPYLQPDFNMAQLSVLIHVPLHHLAFYFKEIKKQSFTDFRNEWRVNQAKELIRAGKSSDLTLEAIGILSGFSNRNTLLNSFKKFEGVSPQAYLAQLNRR